MTTCPNLGPSLVVGNFYLNAGKDMLLASIWTFVCNIDGNVTNPIYANKIFFGQVMITILYQFVYPFF